MSIIRGYGPPLYVQVIYLVILCAKLSQMFWGNQQNKHIFFFCLGLGGIQFVFSLVCCVQ